MRPETLLAKFSLKGLNYEQMHNGGGKGLFSLEEQLAMVGITWKESPVGFLVLFVECLSDERSANLLYKSTLIEAQRLMQNWRGAYPDKALKALCVTAMMEACNDQGRICSECNGSGKVRDKHRNVRNCMCCVEGRIEWECETRFAVFCQTLPITYSRFRKYHSILLELTKWLTGQRTAAMLAMMERIEEEEAA
ncbi:hypothetical protein [Vibrio diazotrophicus]|uniref:Uncharacterized protein n=1 Tax=Vibrio diazotrophicus TaxID=685 RepID=A0ABX4WA81_VIBDI|nr:hypothetical protein [Vibrio diazotrophicus]PNH99586.1 hypothetical protein C1O25_16100 [Vibrio diazotrophicus]